LEETEEDEREEKNSIKLIKINTGRGCDVPAHSLWIHEYCFALSRFFFFYIGSDPLKVND
jgi:hypothetical protein